MNRRVTRINKSERSSRVSLTIILAVFVFFVLLSAVALASLTVFILERVGVFSDSEDMLELGPIVLVMILVSLVLGFVIAFFSAMIPLKPINELINKMNRLAEGDFKARLKFGSALSSHPAFREISESFNKMAEELDNTELLRNDFINNFSHEFKTPIVSIKGFAKLLKNDGISDEQRKAYLESIEEESLRLSSMATNVLELCKVEKQTILTDISRFNLSEQIRGVLLLCEEKWTKKSLELRLDFDEYEVEANEELLRQVWINLLDNAVKFAEPSGILAIEILKRSGYTIVSIGNSGERIPEDKRQKIFNKFYQADESHATKGNGIGLAIVKRIVDLHKGEISVEEREGLTIFSVILPTRVNGN